MENPAASWFYGFGAERKGPYTADQIGALIQAAVIDEHTKMWSEAIGEWMPLFRTELRSLLDGKAILPPLLTEDKPTSHGLNSPIAGPDSSGAQGVQLRDNRLLGTVLYWLTILCMLISAFQSVFLLRAGKTPEEKYALSQVFITDGVMLFTLSPVLAGMITFFIWKYRLTDNLVRLRGARSITPAGAVYWYFVPVLWFWKPYEAMKNLVTGFDMNPSKRWLLVVWWLGFWTTMLFSFVRAGFLEIDVQTRLDMQAYVLFDVIEYGLDALFLFFAAKLLKELSKAEAEATSGGERPD